MERAELWQALSLWTDAGRELEKCRAIKTMTTGMVVHKWQTERDILAKRDAIRKNNPLLGLAADDE